MSKVYFKAIDSYSKLDEIKAGAKELLKTVVSSEKVELERDIPLKVHFGEKGNDAFIAPKYYEGIIEHLKDEKINGTFIETNAIYSGSRMTREKHTALAIEHGFTQLPIVIADGDRGEDYAEVDITGKHFKKCKIAGQIASKKQMIVLSHFKGHMMAGFGGAIKQLAMGCAARGGKLEQHIAAKPFIIPFFMCKKCMTCVKHCPADAIHIGFYSWIDTRKCIGCAACIAWCPHKAIYPNIFRAQFSYKFREKIVEYALAAHQGKRNIYITYAFNLAKGCDCEGHKMKMVAKDLGLFASLDPVAIDSACMDLIDRNEGRKVYGGRDALDYAAKIGLGSKQYELITL